MWLMGRIITDPLSGESRPYGAGIAFAATGDGAYGAPSGRYSGRRGCRRRDPGVKATSSPAGMEVYRPYKSPSVSGGVLRHKIGGSSANSPVPSCSSTTSSSLAQVWPNCRCITRPDFRPVLQLEVANTNPYLCWTGLDLSSADTVSP